MYCEISYYKMFRENDCKKWQSDIAIKYKPWLTEKKQGSRTSIEKIKYFKAIDTEVLCKISAFCSSVEEVSVLLGCDVAPLVNWFLMYQDDMLTSFSRVEISCHSSWTFQCWNAH